MKKITVVEVNNIDMYPPVQNLVRVLLSLNYRVDLIGGNATKVSDSIRSDRNCKIIETPSLRTNKKITKWVNRVTLPRKLKAEVSKSMIDSEVLWTTSMNTIRSIGDLAFQYRNVLQLMELSEYGYRYKHLIKFPIDEYARKSWKTVVPELNRAYIQKTWWQLKKTPYILPNKPFNLDPGDLDEKLKVAIDKMKFEKRRIILYLGGIYEDRDFENYAKAINDLDGYSLYIVGKAYSNKTQETLANLVHRYPVEYLGAFDPPHHLALVKYAYMGLLPYKAVPGGDLSILNALYCAPNKLFEYAGFGVPMIGSDVLGLKIQFEKWNMGVCCNEESVEEIKEAIEFIDSNHIQMSENSKKFYNSVDLQDIVLKILEDK